MTDVINIISQITNKYGNQIITESRFVHIFNDLYPSRNNPAYVNILKSIINDGCSSDLLTCTKKNIKIKVEDTATRLATQYGYDKNVVSEILYSLIFAKSVPELFHGYILLLVRKILTSVVCRIHSEISVFRKPQH